MKLNSKLLFLPTVCLAVFYLGSCGSGPTTTGTGVGMTSDSVCTGNCGGGGKTTQVLVAVIDSPNGGKTVSNQDSVGTGNTGGGGSPKSNMMYSIPIADNGSGSGGSILIDKILYNNLTKNLGQKKAHEHRGFILVAVNYSASDSVGTGNTGHGGTPPPPPPPVQIQLLNSEISQIFGTGKGGQ